MSKGVNRIREMEELPALLGEVALRALEMQEFRAFSMLGQARQMTEGSVAGEAALGATLGLLLERGMSDEERKNPAVNPELSGASLTAVARAVVERGGISEADKAFWGSGEAFRANGGLPRWAEKRLSAMPDGAADLLAAKGRESVKRVMGAASSAEFAKFMDEEVGSELGRKLTKGALATGATVLAAAATSAAATPLIAGFAMLSAMKAVSEGRTEKGVVRGVAGAAKDLAKDGVRLLRDSAPAKAIGEGVSSLRSMGSMRGLAEKAERVAESGNEDPLVPMEKDRRRLGGPS